jgi:AraC-like DNA-binding protein
MFTPTHILEIVEKRLLPWITDDKAPPLVVAQPRLKTMKTMTDLPVIPKKLQGPRKIMRSFNFAGINAHYPKDELVETRSMLLTFVLSGEADVHCGDYVLQVPRGRAVLVPAGVPRRHGADSIIDLGDNPARFSEHINFTDRCGSLEVWRNADRGNLHIGAQLEERYMIPNLRLLQLLEEIQEEVTATRLFQEDVARRLIEVFLLLLLRHLREEKAKFPGRLPVTYSTAGRLPVTYSTAVSQHSPIYQAQQYIHAHLPERLTQDNVARRVRLSRTQFIRLFHEETGQTFNQFVTTRRLEQAKSLLENTDFPLTFICNAVGYRSTVYFNTVFRKHMGMLPSEYRDKLSSAKKTGKGSA